VFKKLLNIFLVSQEQSMTVTRAAATQDSPLNSWPDTQLQFCSSQPAYNVST